MEELFNEKNKALVFSETNKNYHNLFESFLSTIKNRKITMKDKPKQQVVVKKEIKRTYKEIGVQAEIKRIILLIKAKRKY